MTVELETVVVRGIASGGEGVATLADGRAVFVPRAAVGDRIRLKDVRLKARYGRARVAQVVDPGADRVEPICPHYVADDCGGCQLMHLGPPAQLRAKSVIVGEALRRIAKLDVTDPPVSPPVSPFNYRAKITLTWNGRALGFRPVDHPDRVFDLHECHIADPALNALHQALSAARQTLPRTGARVTYRLDADRHVHLIITTEAGSAAWSGDALVTALRTTASGVTVWWQPEDGAPRVVQGGKDPFPATVFEQVNPAMGRLVREAALRALGDVKHTHVWDLYAGIGTSSDALVDRGATVESVELDRRAVALAERLGRAGVQRHAGRVEDTLHRLSAPRSVLTNPPRTGMGEAVTRVLAATAASRIVYISCDAATLARDLSRLNEHYRLADLAAFDQFPQTAHVECVATLERR